MQLHHCRQYPIKPATLESKGGWGLLRKSRARLVCPKCEGQVDVEYRCEEWRLEWDREELRYRGRIIHDLRRCAARNLLAAGVPQAIAMKITGHKTDSMFRRYAIVTVEQQREALRLAALYRQQQAHRQKVTAIN